MSNYRDGNQDFHWIGTKAFTPNVIGELRYGYANGNTYILGNNDADPDPDFTITVAQVNMTFDTFNFLGVYF